ncbi:unnamed protein product [Camellia sinensis]
MESISTIQTRRVQISRKKLWNIVSCMEMVFTGASVTGKHHWTSRENVVEAADVLSDFVDSIGAQPFVDPIPARVEDVDSDSLIELV